MATKKWVADPTHSEIQFKVKHLMITNVTGSFNSFDISAETNGDDFTNAAVSFSADIRSIDTGNEQRDGHLQSPDFFDAAAFPKLTFRATRISPAGDGHYTLEGDMTIRDTTRNISLTAEFAGIVKDPYGNTKAGFTVTGKINRKDFGLTWNAVTEAGGVVVSDEVRLFAEVQLVEQAA